MPSTRKLGSLAAAVAVGFLGFASPGVAQVQTEHFQSDVDTVVKPWTHLDFYNDPKNFQFAIISDRAGGVRPGVFLDGVKKLNLLMPEFVMSVGDFIPGNTSDREQLLTRVGRIRPELNPLKVPFFYVPGNHDINNDVMRQVWNERSGVPFYSFVYKEVLFLALDTPAKKASPFLLTRSSPCRTHSKSMRPFAGHLSSCITHYGCTRIPEVSPKLRNCSRAASTRSSRGMPTTISRSSQ